MPRLRDSAGSRLTSATPTTSILQTVGRFLDACDFYTIDVADFIGNPAPAAEIDGFVERHTELLGRIHLEERRDVLRLRPRLFARAARKYLTAVKKAGEVYRT